MRLSHLFSGLALGAALSLSAAAASAGESEYPLSYVERPLTLPRFVLAPELNLTIERGLSESCVGFTQGSPICVNVEAGAAFGITKDLEVGATVLSFRSQPGLGFGYSEPQIRGTYRFLSGQFELGVQLRATFFVNYGAGVFLQPSVPMLLHLGKVARLDLNPGLDFALRGGCLGNGCAGTGGNAIGFELPVRFDIDIIEPLHVGANTGIFINDFGHAKESAAIPLGVFAGYAIGGKKPIVDIDPYFQWRTFVTPGGGINGDKINPGNFQVGVEARLYLYL